MPSLSFRAGIGQCFFFCINEFIYWMCWALFVYAIGIATTLAVVMESSHGSSGVRSLLWALNVGKSTLTASGGVTAWVCVWESTWVKSLSLRWLWGWGTDGGFSEWPIAVARFPLLRYLLGRGERGGGGGPLCFVTLVLTHLFQGIEGQKKSLNEKPFQYILWLAISAGQGLTQSRRQKWLMSEIEARDWETRLIRHGSWCWPIWRRKLGSN